MKLSMRTSQLDARRMLRCSLERIVIPELAKRGFTLLRRASGAPPIWVFNRPRNDGGYDVLDLMMESGKRPHFDARINVVSEHGISRSWGAPIPAKEAMACDSPVRIAIARNAFQNRTFRALARWVGIGWFGYKASGDPALNERLAVASCVEFVSTLDQAEAWWSAKEFGPNLVKESIGVIHHSGNFSL